MKNLLLKRISLVCILLCSQYTFALSDITLTTTSGATTNQAPTYPTTSFTLTPGSTSFVIPVSDDVYHYVWQYGDTSLTNENRSTVSLDHQLCDPVVVGSPTYDVDGTPERAKRFRDLDQDSFDVQVDAWLDGTFVGSTTVDWMVLEKWSHTMIDNTKIQAWSDMVSLVRADSCRDNRQWTQVDFSPAFDAEPGVLYGVSSYNDSSWVAWKVYGTAGRASDPTQSSMYMTLERSFNTCVHQPETIDWVAFDQSHLTSNGIIFDSLKSADNVACCSSVWYAVPYAWPFVTQPQTIMVGQLSEDGWNGSWAVTHSNPATALQSYASVDEDSAGSRAHTAEDLWQIAISNNAWYFVTDNVLTHTLWWADASSFVLQNATWSVIDDIQVQLASPPVCGNQTYTITIQSSDNHHCDAKSSVVQTITVEYIDTDTDGDGVPDCEDICQNNARSTTTGWPANHNSLCTQTSQANLCGEVNSINGSIECDGWCSVSQPPPPALIDTDNDWYPDCQDCNDTNAAINPGVVELCNGVDDDCDSEVDEDFVTLWSMCDGDDADQCSDDVYVCSSDQNWVVCLDNQNNNTEICDGIDNDCDGLVDEWFDSDGDWVVNCDDNCPLVANPNQEDIDTDGVWDVCDNPDCSNWVLEWLEECDDGNLIANDGCSVECEIEYCRDDAPLTDTSKNFVITSLDPTSIAGTSSQPDSKVAICLEDTTGTRDIFYTTTDASGTFTYTPDLTPYAAPRVNVWVMLHDQDWLDIDHHSLIVIK